MDRLLSTRRNAQKGWYERITISEAFTPILDEPEIGYEVGIIGWLTKGKMNRKDYTKLAVEMARIQMDNAALYEIS